MSPVSLSIAKCDGPASSVTKQRNSALQKLGDEVITPTRVRSSPGTRLRATVPFSPASKSLANTFVTNDPAGAPAHICRDGLEDELARIRGQKTGPQIYLDVDLLAGGQVCELRRVVVGVGDQDVNGGGGVEARVALVRDHHLQSVLAVTLSVQRHPVDDLTWRADTRSRTRPGNRVTARCRGDSPVLALMRKNFPSESRM